MAPIGALMRPAAGSCEARHEEAAARPGTRMKLYEAVMRRRARGRELQPDDPVRRGGVPRQAHKSHVSNWLRGDHLPDGSVRKFVPTPTAELGYVIGVMLGDGSMSVCGDHSYKLKLRVTDRDFAEAFAEADRCRPREVRPAREATTRRPTPGTSMSRAFFCSSS